MCERGSVVALLQEPYSSYGGVRGLPAEMRVFPDSRCYAAVVVNDPNVECTLVSSTDWGVCVGLEGNFGRLFVVSVYCKFSEDINPYLQYMDEVLLQVSGNPVILGLDANASSPLWFSKMSRHRFGYRNYQRGETLAEWVITQEIQVVNEPSEWYTFHSSQGKSDIDVTLVNESAMRVCAFQWSVLGGHGVSD
ncbi:hypothetical protein KR026_003018, partial [Drosophila bipectinata]